MQHHAGMVQFTYISLHAVFRPYLQAGTVYVGDIYGEEGNGAGY